MSDIRVLKLGDELSGLFIVDVFLEPLDIPLKVNNSLLDGLNVICESIGFSESPGLDEADLVFAREQFVIYLL